MIGDAPEASAEYGEEIATYETSYQDADPAPEPAGVSTFSY